MLTVRIPKNRAVPKPKTPVVVVQPVKSKRARRNRRARKLLSLPLATSASRPQNPTFASWIDTLNDPFNYPPIPLGFGTFSTTSLATAYYHGSINANATDGTFSLAVGPSLLAGIQYNNSTFSGTAWSSANFQNYNYIEQLGGLYRVISIGVRAIPLVASTSVPGVLYAGTIGDNLANITASGGLNAASLISSSPSVHVGMANYGCTVVSRPMDDVTSEFLLSTKGNNTAFTDPGWNTIVMSFVNLPVSTTVIFEAVMNIEVLSGINAVISGNEVTGQLGGDLVSVYPTYTNAFRAAMPYLCPSVQLNFNADSHPTLLQSMSRNRLRSYNLSRLAAGAGTGSRLGSFADQISASESQKGTVPPNVTPEFQRTNDDEPVKVASDGSTDADRTDAWNQVLTSLSSVGISVAGLSAGLLSTAMGRRALYDAIDRGVEHLPV